MSGCSGPDCTHESHNDGNPKAAASAPVEQTEALVPAEQEKTRNPIITPADPERWPLLEMPSQMCSIPLKADDEQVIGYMDQLLTQLDTEAAGLAAIQVGYPYRIFLLRNGKDAEGKPENLVYINPVLVSVSKELKKAGEACLSLPGMGMRCPRPKSLKLQYFNLRGELCTEDFDGFWARAVMHEMDHLNGILLSRHFEKEIAKQPRRTTFGMRLTPHRVKVINKRRAAKKFSKRQRQKIGR